MSGFFGALSTNRKRKIEVDNDKKWLIKASSWKCCKIAVIQEVNGRVSQKTTYQRPPTSS